MWPDVGIKSSPKSPKVAKKLTTAVLFFKLILFKIFQNRTKYFELLFQEILLPRTFKNSPIWCLHTFPNRNICFLFSLYLLIQNWSHLNGLIPASFSFFLFSSFPNDTIEYILMQAYMLCLGLEPRAAGWKVQTIPLSHGGTFLSKVILQTTFASSWSPRGRRPTAFRAPESRRIVFRRREMERKNVH